MPEDFTDTGSTDITPSDSIDSDLAATWNQLHPDQPAPVQEQAPPSYDGPQSWSAPMRQRLSALPPDYADVRQYIEQRERQQHEAISRMGREAKQYEPLRKLIHDSNLPEDMPIEDVVRHLEGAFVQGDAAARMKEMAEAYARDYEPLKPVLEQFHQRFPDVPPHLPLGELLQRTTAMQSELATVRQAESRRAFDEYAAGKPHLADPGFQTELAAEMRAILKDAPGLRGERLLRLAHDNLADRKGISRQIEQQREQQQARKIAENDAAWQQAIAQRDAEWQQLIAQREAEGAKRDQEREAQRQRDADAKAKWARQAARINSRGSPGHGTNPKTIDATLREIAARHYC